MLFSFIADSFLLLALHLDESNRFPPPLSAAEERSAIEAMRQGDAAARDRLIEHNLRLVAHIAKKYYSEQYENDELVSIGTLGLIKAISTFRPGKGARLSTYAARCIDNEILMHFRRKKKTALDVSFDEPLEQDADGNTLTLIDLMFEDDNTVETIEKKENLKKLRRCLLRLPEGRDKEILFLRYGMADGEPRTQNEIAAQYGISRSYVSRIETKMLKKLRRLFEEE